MLKKLRSCSLIWSLSCRLSHPNFHFEPVHMLLCGYSFREDLISLGQQGNSKPTNPTPNPLLGLKRVPSTSLLRSSLFSPHLALKACSEQHKRIWIVLIQNLKKNQIIQVFIYQIMSYGSKLVMLDLPAAEGFFWLQVPTAVPLAPLPPRFIHRYWTQKSGCPKAAGWRDPDSTPEWPDHPKKRVFSHNPTN